MKGHTVYCVVVLHALPLSLFSCSHTCIVIVLCTLLCRRCGCVSWSMNMWSWNLKQKSLSGIAREGSYSCTVLNWANLQERLRAHTAGHFPATELHSLSTVKLWKSGTPYTMYEVHVHDMNECWGPRFRLSLHCCVWFNNIPGLVCWWWFLLGLDWLLQNTSSFWLSLRIYQYSCLCLYAIRVMFLRSLSMLPVKEEEVCLTCLCTPVEGAWHFQPHW